MAEETTPREEMDRAVRKMCRRVASMLIEAMAWRDMSYADVDARLERPKGFTKRQVIALSEGRAVNIGLRTLAECAWALDVDVRFSVSPIKPPAASET